MTAARLAVLLLAMFGAGGCASVGALADKLNPWSSSTPKPPELSAIQPTAQIGVDWQASIGSAGNYVLMPAVVGTSVFAAGRDGTVARFDAGRQTWRVAAGPMLSGGVGSDGKLVVVGTPKGEVIALDAQNGTLLWQARVSSEVLAPPAVDQGLVVVRSGDGRVFGFEARDGKRRWVYQRSTPALSLRSTAGAVFAGRFILAGFAGGKLVALGANNGAAVWEVAVALPKGSTELERVADLVSVPVISGREVCAVAYQGRVACFDTVTGNQLWSRDMSSSAGLDMDGQNVYVSDDKGAVHALQRADGASIWKQDKLMRRGLSRPVAAGEYIAVGDSQGIVHLLRRQDGAFAARLATDGSAILADPERLGTQGSQFVIQTQNGSLYALSARGG